MFKSTIVKAEVGVAEDFCLFVNPPSSTKVGVDIFLKVKSDKNRSTNWKIYHNPTVTSNGTVQTVVDDNNVTTTLNTLNLYKSPTVTDRGLELRTFPVPENPEKFYSAVPYMELLPGHSLLIRRMTCGGGKITAIWQWVEQ